MTRGASDAAAFGLYAVKTPGGRVAMVLAESADTAAEYLAFHIARQAGVSPALTEPDTYTVGRLGTYDPGMEGARMLAAAGGVLG